MQLMRHVVPGICTASIRVQHVACPNAGTNRNPTPLKILEFAHQVLAMNQPAATE